MLCDLIKQIVKGRRCDIKTFDSTTLLQDWIYFKNTYKMFFCHTDNNQKNSCYPFSYNVCISFVFRSKAGGLFGICAVFLESNWNNSIKPINSLDNFGRRSRRLQVKQWLMFPIYHISFGFIWVIPSTPPNWNISGYTQSLNYEGLLGHLEIYAKCRKVSVSGRVSRLK